MSSFINQLSTSIAAALPNNLINTVGNTITISPNSIHFSSTMGGGIAVNQGGDSFITVTYRSTARNNLRFLIWGKDRFACIPGIALSLNGDEFNAAVKLDFNPQALKGNGRKDLERSITRFVGQFVVKCEKILDSIYDAHLAPELSIFLEAQIGSGNIGHSWSLDSMDYGA